MADRYCSNFQKEFISVPSEKGGNGEYGSPVRFYFDEIVVDAADYITSGDVIKICKLNKESRVVRAFATSDCTLTAGILNVGVKDVDADGLIAGWDPGANDLHNEGTGILIATKLSAEGVVEAVCTETFAGLTAGSKLRFVIEIADC